MLIIIRYLFIALLVKWSSSSTTNIVGKVSGKVMNEKAAPLKNKLVSLASDSLVVRMTRTNDKGNFVFDKLPQGNYRILIMISGYKKFTTGFFQLTESKPSRDFREIALSPSAD
ncbi:carboxypeptidase-like regulatory domain-containing protein [Pedobacter insulae]|uniref:Carboxypeptidase regulatory-like domain-containing protein n=1 Tax=Pedobacter insulae TaxID=414048 RepID=A0A1I3A6U5_9SPHI|nr:carboxypeptidase-like regulatory domain-containing protein [Pedobacter insulae]SFH45738.1 Carboxypeptidase regulatory-like domain-containing protein [Pedobacter insulae]